MKYKKPIIDQVDLLELIHFARRYCDGRKTNVPLIFNDIYERLIKDNYWMGKEPFDKTVKNFPHAEKG